MRRGSGRLSGSVCGFHDGLGTKTIETPGSNPRGAGCRAGAWRGLTVLASRYMYGPVDTRNRPHSNSCPWAAPKGKAGSRELGGIGAVVGSEKRYAKSPAGWVNETVRVCASGVERPLIVAALPAAYAR